MRVIDHRRSSQKPERQRQSHKLVVLLGLILLGGAGGFAAFVNQSQSPQKIAKANQQIATTQNNALQIKSSDGVLKKLTGQQFYDVYNTFVYPNTKPIIEETPITGNETADIIIRKVAVSRGYALRSAPVSNAFQEVETGMKLQQRAAQPWLDLRAEAKKSGINLGLTAAYRSADDQRQIFTQRLAQLGITPQMIAYGGYDAQVSQVLRSTAIPGFSRHHTGYTIDIACEDQPATSFDYTTCFKWLSANNYEHTKKHGWIPSYPEGSGPQGPDPEAWEYVWVGIAPLTE